MASVAFLVAASRVVWSPRVIASVRALSAFLSASASSR
jgi:hypothetical protein